MTGAAAPVLRFDIRHRLEVGSTNAEAAALAKAGAPEGTVVLADRQSAGRGRRGRGWVSPAGNLYASVVLRPDCAIAATPQLGFVAAVALADALDSVLPADARAECKWPNDVLVRGGKVAGILLEMAGRDAVVLGIGLNLAEAPVVAAEGGAGLPAVSVRSLSGDAPAPEPFLERILLPRLCSRYREWRTGGFASVRTAWLVRSRPRGTSMEVRLPKTVLSGTFEEIDLTGALVLAMPDGARRSVAAGDVLLPLEGR